MASKFQGLIKKYLFEIFLFSLLFVFSSYLMWKTFQVSPDGNMLLASRVWSDFAATIPLIRSFSYGSNFPPQYPIFAGPPIRYHFVFFSLVGLLEKVGIRIDWALNLPSILSFFLLCIAIYLIGKTVFKSRGVGIVSILLFLFNGSWGFLEFFEKHPLSLNTPSDIFQNTEFSSFGPYDGRIVSAFWSLNIFTNQRHLALAYAAFLFLTLALYILSKKENLLTWNKVQCLGILIGLSPFVHLAGFAMLGISLLTFFALYPNLRKKLFVLGSIALILAIPQYLFMGSSSIETKLFNPGYLIENKTPLGYLQYWFLNLGITALLAPVGFFFANKSQRKVFLPFLALFVIGNLFQFSPEVAANHKFFNLTVVGINFFTALFLVKLWKTKVVGKFAALLLIVPLTITGTIDFFPIKNDRLLTLVDIPNNTAAKFILENTPKGAVFLNSSYLYNPASLAGRKIFMGWPYFPWSAGYDTDARLSEMKGMFSPTSKRDLCSMLVQKDIDYVEIQNPANLENLIIDYFFFEENFTKVFEDPSKRIKIYDIKTACNS